MNKKILFVVNVDWFFISHRLPLAIEALKRGYEVSLVCKVTTKKEYLKNLGISVYDLNFSRSGKNIFREIKVLWQLRRILKKLSPSVVHFITIKPIIYGGIASKFLPIKKKVFAISGFGYTFIQQGIKANFLRWFIKQFYSFAIGGKNSSVIIQNSEDKKIVKSMKNMPIFLIKGSGVDLKKYHYITENNEKIVIVMASRLLKDKGVLEYIEAAKIIRQKGLNTTFELYGDIDEGNPATLTVSDLEKIKNEKNVVLKGFSSDIPTIFSHANIVVLPSYREGLPKVLIEAAACGRAVVTTNVAGCKDAIIPNTTGLLCEVKDSNSLAMQIEKLILDVKLRNDMGKAGRVLAEEKFDINKIVAEHFSIYENEK